MPSLREAGKAKVAKCHECKKSALELEERLVYGLCHKCRKMPISKRKHL